MASKKLIRGGMVSFRSTITTAITTAFGLIIALFWRDAIQAWIANLLATLRVPGTGYIYSLIAAIVVTVIGTIAIWIIARWNKNTT